MNQDRTADKQRGFFRIGDLLNGRYEIRDAIGLGGFAVVYMAFDQTIEREVAVKVLDIQHMAGTLGGTTRVVERFLREARVAAKIRHPSVIQIYDFGILEEERPFIVMERLRGHNLRDEIANEGPMNAGRLLPIFCDALVALGEAHELGVMHKDLKPANLFVSEPGSRQESLKILDFGIAHVDRPGQERYTEAGVLSGTPQYLPPEYIEFQKVSPAMDIYQMGLILVEALTGEAAVQEEQPYAAIVRHTRGELLIPETLLVGEMGEVLRRALAMNPEERFGTAGEFADALRLVTPSSLPGTFATQSMEYPQPDTDLAWTAAADAAETQVLGPGMDPEATVALSAPPSELVEEAQARQAPRLAGPRLAGPQTLLGVTADPPTDITEAGSTPSRSRRILGVVVLGLLVMVILVALFAWNQPEEIELAVEEPPAAEVMAVEEEEPEPPPAPLEIRLESTPPGALVVAGDEPLGPTPVDLVMLPDETREVSLELDGYRPHSLTVSGDTASPVAIELEAVPPPPPPPRPAPRPEPEPDPEPSMRFAP